MILYRTVQHAVRMLWPRLIGPVQVYGLDNIPGQGPFVLVCNHQSILDPILIQALCPRPIHTMAKSTQFAAPVLGGLMKRVLSYPVRRFEIDPQAVRLTLRYLEHGEPVGVYPEGERSWDGRLQSFRRGTLHWILKAGAPVVPCTIDGSYDVWPRWARRPTRVPVSVTFGPPLEFGRHDHRRDRETAMPEAERRLRIALQAPMRRRHSAGEPPSTRPWPPVQLPDKPPVPLPHPAGPGEGPS
jgi:1-acyl-sn-glycerol-3-phosphate acyltransferase